MKINKYIKEFTYQDFWDKLREKEMFTQRYIFEYLIIEYESNPYRFSYSKNVAEYFGFGYAKNFSFMDSPQKIFLVNIFNPNDVLKISFIDFTDYLKQGKICILNKNTYTNSVLNFIYDLSEINKVLKKSKKVKEIQVLGNTIKGFSYDEQTVLKTSIKNVPEILKYFLENDPMDKEMYLLPYHVVIIENFKDKKGLKSLIVNNLKKKTP